MSIPPVLSAILQHYPLNQSNTSSVPPPMTPPAIMLSLPSQSVLKTASQPPSRFLQPRAAIRSPIPRPHGSPHAVREMEINLRGHRTSASPSRPHHLTALSPLQSFTSLKPEKASHERPVGTKTPETLSRANSQKSHKSHASLSRSLSRRDSLYANAARWGTGGDEEENVPSEFFSRLTLVRAPSETGLRT
jgi:hypothetical protein